MAICFLARQNIVTQNLKYIYDSVSNGRLYSTVIAHISEGPSNASTKGWFETYPKIINGRTLPEKDQYAGAHFGIEKNGQIEQFADTKLICWGAGASNPHAIHVENVGMPGDSLTDDQVEMMGNILAWANQVHSSIALQLNFLASISDPQVNKVPINSPFYGPLNSGLGFHAQYGGHPQCPGSRIVGQLPAVLQVAKDIASGARSWRMH
jgi:hypothetical protein